jgi:hypothetical protein
MGGAASAPPFFWKHIPLGRVIDRHIRKPAMKNICVVIGFILILSSTSHAQWTKLSPPPTDTELGQQYVFFSKDSGLLLADDNWREAKTSLFSTSDGGSTWTSIDDFPSPRTWVVADTISGHTDFEAMRFQDRNVGYVFQSHRGYDSTGHFFRYKQELFRTIDGGHHWQLWALPITIQQQFDTAWILSTLHILNKDVLAISADRFIATSSDQGNKWQFVTSGNPIPSGDIGFKNLDTLLQYRFSNGSLGNPPKAQMHRSTNGGINWHERPSSNFKLGSGGQLDGWVPYLTLSHNGKFWSGYAGNVIFTSTNDGDTWAMTIFTRSDKASHIQQSPVFFQGRYFFVGSTDGVSEIIESTDEGLSWRASSLQLPETGGALLQVSQDSTTLFATYSHSAYRLTGPLAVHSRAEELQGSISVLQNRTVVTGAGWLEDLYAVDLLGRRERLVKIASSQYDITGLRPGVYFLTDGIRVFKLLRQ